MALEYESHLSGNAQFLLDATLGFEQNDIVKTLTVASVVGIPRVLVARAPLRSDSDCGGSPSG